MKVIVFRGIMGSGKSTLAEKMVKDGGVICSADNYFMQGGEYKFDGRDLPLAHKSCMRDFLGALAVGEPLIVVDNTNTQLWEATPYISVAEAMGYEVEVHEVECDADVAATRNIHGVPRDAVHNAAKRWQKSLPWWKVVVHKEAK